MTQDFQIRTEIQPGDIGYIIFLHGSLYAREYGMDQSFEGDVAIKLGEFLKTHDPARDYFAVAEIDGRIVGSVFISGFPDHKAQLRFFIVHPESRGRGLGRRLIQVALAFCRENGVREVELWTLSELKAACHLYREAGFKCVEEKMENVWGARRTVLRFELSLG